MNGTDPKLEPRPQDVPLTPVERAKSQAIRAQHEYTRCLAHGIGFSARPEHWLYYFPSTRSIVVLHVRSGERQNVRAADPLYWIPQADRIVARWGQ